MSKGLPRVSFTLQEVGILLLLFIFYSKGCLVGFSTIRGCLEKILGCGNAALF